MLTKKLQRYGTFGTHDALKLVALLSMFADHAGAFFYPQHVELRIVGRIAAPIFFFLIGYSKSYRTHADLVAAAAFLVALKLAMAHSLGDMNILVSFILARGFFQAAEKYPALLAWPWIAFALLAVLVLPATEVNLLQYAPLGWMFALLGYVQKNRDRFGKLSRAMMFFVAFYLCTFQHVLQFRLLAEGAFALTLLLSACAVLLWFYRPRKLAFPPALRGIEPALAWPARYSLWIYAAHLAALQIATGQYV